MRRLATHLTLGPHNLNTNLHLIQIVVLSLVLRLRAQHQQGLIELAKNVGAKTWAVKSHSGKVFSQNSALVGPRSSVMPLTSGAGAANLLGPCGFAACSGPPVAPFGPLGLDHPLYPPVLLVSLGSPVCPLVPLVSLLIPPRALRCPWCLLGPTVV
jgi:hypothetical protein